MLYYFLVLLVFAVNASPSDEMEKFIEECNVMVDTMESCAQGWVDFEQEIIDSIDSFADRIVYTEGLIMEETELILDMAGRIVETEEIMIELVESCNCSSKAKNEARVVDIASKTDAAAQTLDEPLSLQPEEVAMDSKGLMDDKCSAMDYIIEVMDACIKAFEVFNNDFLEVLSYMDSAIQDMGDRIVDTECLIVNMSYQIGDMADRIVETEVMMADMASSCCRGGNTVYPPASRPSAHLRSSETSRRKTQYGDDDLLSHCTFESDRESALRFSRLEASAKMQKAWSKLNHSLSTGKIGAMRQMHSHVGAAVSVVGKEGGSKDIMPCESIFNPFCCAAEVCADMMVEMLEMMASGADWMTDMCEACIDEIGKLADDIVKTEEQIVMMGYAIGDMSDCILVFIDQGLEFMQLFCPAAKGDQRYFVLEGSFADPDDEGCSDSSHLLQLKSALVGVGSQTVSISVKRKSQTDLRWAQQRELASKIQSFVKRSRSRSSLVGDNPFGEFAEMVDVMMRTMAVFTDMMTDQTRLMNDMFNSLGALSAEEAKMGAMVVDMGSDVLALGAEVIDEEELMMDLSECMD